MSGERSSQGRVPPHSLDAEKSVLGAVLLSPSSGAIAMQRLIAEDFYLGAHGRIFEAMIALSYASKPVDLVTLSHRLEVDGVLEAVGGYAYLAELSEFVPTAGNIALYAQIVKSYSTLRKLIGACGTITQDCFDANKEAGDILADAEKAIFNISQTENAQSFVHIKKGVNDSLDIIEERFNNPGAVTGLKSGFPSLDNKTTGMHPGELILVAGRPAMGKSTFGLNIAQQAAFENPGCNVAIFSLEMPYEQISERYLSSVSGILYQNIRTGRMEMSDWDKLGTAADKLGGCGIYIDDTPGITVMEMLSKCRRLKMEHGLSLIVIDYLQLISSAGSKSRDSRQQEISEITRAMKIMAMELGLPIILLSQLSRAVEQRQDKRPILSDLRESGAIEQDADVVIFIYRDDYYKQEEAKVDPSVITNEAEIIIRKQRNGPTGTVRLTFDGSCVRFRDIEDRYDEPPAYVGM